MYNYHKLKISFKDLKKNVCLGETYLKVGFLSSAAKIFEVEKASDVRIVVRFFFKIRIKYLLFDK